jgi:hypothetical protein
MIGSNVYGTVDSFLAWQFVIWFSPGLQISSVKY